MEPILSHSSFEVFPSACLSTVSFVVLSEKIVGLASTDLSGPASHPFAPDVSSVTALCTALCACSSVWTPVLESIRKFGIRVLESIGNFGIQLEDLALGSLLRHVEEALRAAWPGAVPRSQANRGMYFLFRKKLKPLLIIVF